PSHRASATSASSSTARNRGVIRPSFPSASFSECAGSVETRRTRAPAAAVATAVAAAHVVFPTPPLPAKKWNLGRWGAWGVRDAPPMSAIVLAILVPQGGFDAGDLQLAGIFLRAGAALADLADRVEELALGLGELLVGDLAELELHLGGEQLLAIGGIVVQLRL